MFMIIATILSWETSRDSRTETGEITVQTNLYNPSCHSDTHHHNENVQTVPHTLEIVQPVDADLQRLLHHVVQDEQSECHFTHTHKVVPAGHAADQTHRLELPRGHHPAGGRELHQQPDECSQLFSIYFLLFLLEALLTT